MTLLERKKKGGFAGRAPPTEQKQRDDVRILHEAYQFLSKRLGFMKLIYSMRE